MNGRILEIEKERNYGITYNAQTYRSIYIIFDHLVVPKADTSCCEASPGDSQIAYGVLAIKPDLGMYGATALPTVVSLCTHALIYSSMNAATL